MDAPKFSWNLPNFLGNLFFRTSVSRFFSLKVVKSSEGYLKYYDSDKKNTRKY